MRNKDDAAPTGLGSDTRERLTPLDVQQKEFRISFRGYNERDVDEFLDHVTEELQRFEAEVMRLRTGQAAFDPATFDVDAETQRILREARGQADAIVREAEARAAGIPAAGAGEARSIVAPYLNREREFLQSLGSLVQDHAQTIKTMVEEARRRTDHASVRPAAPASDEATPAGAAAAPAAALVRDEVEAPAPGIGEAEPERHDEPDDVVVLSSEERVPGGAERRDEEEDRQPDGARSLRELFWGED